MAVVDRVRTLRERREFYVSYLRMKVEEEDWHGVADAAMDLREVDAELKGLDAKANGR